MNKLCNVEINNNLYHKRAYENEINSLDPPFILETSIFLTK
ncbi:hypothetical protein [Halarcobacter ebronensis]|nr:hypothetical protein [Halarcobacter ebronensis]